MMQATAALALGTLGPSQSYAEGSSMQKPQFSKRGLDALHATLSTYIAAGERPGVVTLVSRDGETHVDAIGTLAFDSTAPMRRDTIFRLASISKPIIGAATLILIEEGKLTLDEPIDRLIPELANRRVLKRLDGPLDDTVPANRPIRVSDLLTLRMGMGAIMAPGDYPIQTELMRAGVFTPFKMPTAPSATAWIEKLATFPLMNQPGEVWRYDTSITLLGALIERAAGAPLGTVLAERLFEPLGMKDSGFVVPAAKLGRFPTAYQRNPQTNSLQVWDPSGPESFFARLPGFPGAHGGLVSTVDDYCAFAQMMLDGGMAGKRRLMSNQSVQVMMSDQIPEDVKARSAFVPGFWEERGWGYAGSIMKQHLPPGAQRGFGWDGGYGTMAYWDPRSRVIAIILSQRLVESPSYPEIFHKFYEGAYSAAGV
jgi:CubicO group peptidase (beta-lactamase class C family)